MRAKIFGAATAAAVAVAATAIAVAPVGASVVYYYYGYSGGSSIKALDNTVTSALTAESTVFGPDAGQSDHNSLASVAAQKVVSLGTVKTTADIKAVSGGTEVVVTSRLADVSVLGGLITASGITITTTTQRVNGVATSTTHSDFAGLKVAGARIPVKIPQNYTLKLGNVATIAINAGKIDNKGSASAALGAGLVVHLLKKQGTAAAGAEINIGQTYTLVAPDSSEGTGHGTGGKAYATAIHAAAGKAVDVRSDPTVPTTVFSHGTGGQTTTNTLAGVNLAPVARIGAVKTTGSGTNTKTVVEATTTASLADINLLGGLITVQGVTVSAHSSLAAKPTTDCTILGLQINGAKTPVKVKPNTVINLGVAKVTLCQEGVSGKRAGVRGLYVVLGKAGFGLPAGAEIEVAAASAMVK
jgi:hypothetical protein